ncbi:MAG TPA: sulfite exporter TauE/SafE family protein [Dehalococcoidales bacterium]|nr:sulfite exporter TauE/SafE family protein [Dehalococcoidales bacterium]
MTIPYIIILMATGMVAGFASGLLGVGGAFIMTPVQYILFTNMGILPDVAIKLAFGTSLLVVLPTAISGTWRHHKKGVVWWKAAIIMGSCGSIAAFGGATLATRLPGEALKIAFGAVVLAAGIRMLTAELPPVEQQPEDKPWLWVACAVPIGLVSGILGVGGAILIIPVTVIVLRFSMHYAIALSLAMMMFTSIGGVIGYIVNGLDVAGLPPYSVGYVNLPSWLLLTVASVGMAQVGAVISHRLQGRYLKYIFTTVLFLLGLRMLGVFDLLGWTI